MPSSALPSPLQWLLGGGIVGFLGLGCSHMWLESAMDPDLGFEASGGRCQWGRCSRQMMAEPAEHGPPSPALSFQAPTVTGLGRARNPWAPNAPECLDSLSTCPATAQADLSVVTAQAPQGSHSYHHGASPIIPSLPLCGICSDPHPPQHPSLSVCLSVCGD